MKENILSRQNKKTMWYIKFTEHIKKECPSLHFLCPFYCDGKKLHNEYKLQEHLENKECKNQIISCENCEEKMKRKDYKNDNKICFKILNKKIAE